MAPYRLLKHLFNSFGHRMLEGTWRGKLLMQHGRLSLGELLEAVRDGHFTMQPPDKLGPHEGRDYGMYCFYRLTAKGWWTGVAIGASFEDPRSRGGGMADARVSRARVRKGMGVQVPPPAPR